MHALIAIAISLAAWAWWDLQPLLFFCSTAAAIFLLAMSDIKSFLLKDALFQKSIRVMTKTDCCLLHDFWSDPTSVKWITVAFRTGAAGIAIVAVLTSWFERERFLSGYYNTVSAVWSAASICWLFSCIPMIVCLIHCAAVSKYKDDTQIPIRSDELIVRFRKVYSLWTLHDIVLGIFWLYLSLMVYDLADDEDDSEWRIVFLSMLSWHIVVVVLHRLYFISLSKLEPRTQRQSGPCCGPQNANNIWSACTVLSYVGMYVIIIRRMQQPNLLNLGTESVLDPIILTLSSLLFAISKQDWTYTPKRADTVPLFVPKEMRIDF